MNTKQTGYAHGNAVNNAARDAINTVATITLKDVTQTADNALEYVKGFWIGMTDTIEHTPSKLR